MENYQSFPLELLSCEKWTKTLTEQEIAEFGEGILMILKMNGYKGATIKDAFENPQGIRFYIDGVKISAKKCSELAWELSTGLASNEIFVKAVFNGSIVVDMAKSKRSVVWLGSLLKDERFNKERDNGLTIPLGVTGKGDVLCAQVDKFPHLLVGGATGTGKSCFIHSALLSLLYAYTPKQLRILLLDPKRVEFIAYKGIPHLITKEAIFDCKHGLNALEWVREEMNNRYDKFAQTARTGKHIFNVDDYNEVVGENEKLPKIVVVVDELADYMYVDKKRVEEVLISITQKSRAAGIHLIVCTQRVSADVISKALCENLLSSVAFRTATLEDSRVLGAGGAEKLWGHGDCLYGRRGLGDGIRLQSPFVTNAEMNTALDYIKNNAGSVEVIDEEIERDEKIEIDSLFIDVLKFLVDEGKASISAIQRKFCVGYNRAGQIIETMVDMGYVSSFDGARARKVLITKEDFETLYGEKSSLLEQVDLQEKSAFSEPPVEKALFVEILRFVIINGSASISVIQRKFSLGYTKAGKIIEYMEDMGYVTPFNGAKPRAILITKEEFEKLYGKL